MNIRNLLYTICIIIFIINIMYFRKPEKKWKTALIGMGSGVAALIPFAFPFGDQWNYAGNQLFYDSGFNGAGHSGRYSDDY